jgi:hypothetical protein
MVQSNLNTSIQNYCPLTDGLQIGSNPECTFKKMNHGNR